MRLATVRSNDSESLCISSTAGLVTIEWVNRQHEKKWPSNLPDLISSGGLDSLNDWYRSGGRQCLDDAGPAALSPARVTFAPLYRRPGKIWGIGLNYVAHAADLSEKAPTAFPASFIKPSTTIIGHGDTIKIPLQSEKTTAEAELGVVIGKRCKTVEKDNWLDVVAGFTTIIDMTAEDILRQNPRYLTLSKCFDTFFSFGPYFVTPDEIGEVNALSVATWINGRVHAENIVSNMTFPPDELVAFHSSVMTLLPGDIISTGTPGAVHIREGDEVMCRISGFEPLINPVADLKIKRRG